MVFNILDCFMISFICGAFFGLVYEFFRIIRRMFPLTAVIFLCDVCFFITAAFFVFNLSMYIGNYIRVYTLLGFGAGVFTYINTLGRIISFTEMLIINLWNNTVGALIMKLIKRTQNAIGVFAHISANKFRAFDDFSKRTAKKLLSPLHFTPDKMYNVKRNIVSSERRSRIAENNGGKNVIQAKIRRSP